MKMRFFSFLSLSLSPKGKEAAGAGATSSEKSNKCHFTTHYAAHIHTHYKRTEKHTQVS